jgi:glycosyltransferase involved in cell wall biosynthesis
MRASVVIPTKHRAPYLDVALRSLAPQAAAQEAELLVVDDGPSEDTRAVAVRHGARYVAHDRSLGLNAARNTGIDATDGELVCFVDDDVAVHPGWLAALLDGAGGYPDDECLTGPIVARFDGFRPRFCGREGPPSRRSTSGRPTPSRRTRGART